MPVSSLEIVLRPSCFLLAGGRRRSSSARVSCWLFQYVCELPADRRGARNDISRLISMRVKQCLPAGGESCGLNHHQGGIGGVFRRYLMAVCHEARRTCQPSRAAHRSDFLAPLLLTSSWKCQHSSAFFVLIVVGVINAAYYVCSEASANSKNTRLSARHCADIGEQ